MGRASRPKGGGGGSSDGSRGVSVLDRNDPAILEPLRSAPIYQKQGTVQARLAKDGEAVETVLEDGRVETTNTASSGDWIVTNPSGEQYVVGPEAFTKKYQESDQEGVFRAKGTVRAIDNPLGADVSIEASWGELQHGDEECIFAASCDAKGNLESDPYIIDRQAFNETYAPA